jgi:uncharacterized protein DUF1266
MANPLTPDQQWILSASAILTVMTRRAPRFDCLGGEPKDAPNAEQTAKTILKNSWGIETREKLESTIEWLGSGGHTADYQKAAAAPATATPQQQAFITQNGAQVGNRGLIAWDLGRLFAVAGWGYLAGFCNDIEAWGVTAPAANRLRAAYTSWDEFAQHYRLGCLFWNADAVGQTDQIIAQLRSMPDSPWKTTPWALGGAAPAPYGAAPPGAAPYGAAPPGAVPGAPGGPPAYAPGTGPLPYTPAPGAIGPAGAAPGAYGAPPPGGAPYGGAPPGAAPYGGAPMVGPAGAAAGGPAKKKTGLLIGLIVGGVFALGLVIVLVLHFAHGSSSHEPAKNEPAKEHPHGKK